MQYVLLGSLDGDGHYMKQGYIVARQHQVYIVRAHFVYSRDQALDLLDHSWGSEVCRSFQNGGALLLLHYWNMNP